MDATIESVFLTFPSEAREYLMNLRNMIFFVAQECGIDDLEETLKWGEPSYICKSGSTLRMAWKAKNPGSISLYFHCQSRLVETFRALYGDKLNLVGNRELRLDLSEALPSEKLAVCIALTLQYHRNKHLPMLGA